MFNTAFKHHNMSFGIVVEDWGEASGAEVAAAQLKRWVRSLGPAEVKALHGNLVKSDTAWGDHPIFNTPEMSALREARLAAQQAGRESSDVRPTDGHHCTCLLVPITDGS